MSNNRPTRKRAEDHFISNCPICKMCFLPHNYFGIDDLERAVLKHVTECSAPSEKASPPTTENDGVSEIVVPKCSKFEPKPISILKATNSSVYPPAQRKGAPSGTNLSKLADQEIPPMSTSRKEKDKPKPRIDKVGETKVLPVIELTNVSHRVSAFLRDQVINHSKSVPKTCKESTEVPLATNGIEEDIKARAVAAAVENSTITPMQQKSPESSAGELQGARGRHDSENSIDLGSVGDTASLVSSVASMPPPTTPKGSKPGTPAFSSPRETEDRKEGKEVTTTPPTDAVSNVVESRPRRRRRGENRQSDSGHDLRRHTGPLAFRCPVCNKSFPASSYFNVEALDKALTTHVMRCSSSSKHATAVGKEPVAKKAPVSRPAKQKGHKRKHPYDAQAIGKKQRETEKDKRDRMSPSAIQALDYLNKVNANQRWTVEISPSGSVRLLRRKKPLSKEWFKDLVLASDNCVNGVVSSDGSQSTAAKILVDSTGKLWQSHKQKSIERKTPGAVQDGKAARIEKGETKLTHVHKQKKGEEVRAAESKVKAKKQMDLESVRSFATGSTTEEKIDQRSSAASHSMKTTPGLTIDAGHLLAKTWWRNSTRKRNPLSKSTSARRRPPGFRSMATVNALASFDIQSCLVSGDTDSSTEGNEDGEAAAPKQRESKRIQSKAKASGKLKLRCPICRKVFSSNWIDMSEEAMSVHIAKCSKTKAESAGSQPLLQMSQRVPSLAKTDCSESMTSSVSDLTADHATAGAKRRAIFVTERPSPAETARARAKRARGLRYLCEGAAKRALDELILRGHKRER